MKHKFSSSPFFAPFLHIISSLYNSSCECMRERVGEEGWEETSTLCNLSKSDEMLPSSSKYSNYANSPLNFDDSVREKFFEWSQSEKNFHMKNCVWTLNIQLHADTLPIATHLWKNSFHLHFHSLWGFYYFTFTTCCRLMSSSIVWWRKKLQWKICEKKLWRCAGCNLLICWGNS